MNKQNKAGNLVYSPISLDLGAKNTGVYMAHRDEGGNLKTEGAVVCLSNGKITYMQKTRTAKRHQRRSIKRKHLVRRLLWQILEGHFGLDYDALPKAAVEFINGLLRRRGFTYLSLDDVPAPEDFADIELAPYLELLPGLQEKCAEVGAQAKPSLADLMRHMGEDVRLAQGIIDCCAVGSKEAAACFRKAAEDGAIIGDPRDYAEGYKVLRETAEATVKALAGGHKPRWDYLKNIEADILASTGIIAPVLQKFGNDGRAFARLVGNLSNLQLRVLRRYFNDPVGKKGDRFDDAKLKGCILRWIKSWHIQKEKDEEKRKAGRREICDALERSPSAIGWLMATPPEKTIPPFEDQDNRRHPTDETLLLDDRKLSKHFPIWRELADMLMEAEEKERGGMLLDSLEDICALQDRKADKNYLSALASRDEAAKKAMNPFPSLEDKKRMYFLARLFDRSKALDPYLCRRLSSFDLQAMEAKDRVPPEAVDAFYKLQRVLSDSQQSHELLKTFFGLASAYYGDIARAKSGLWFDSPETIFRVSGLNTPRKEKIKHILVGNILGVPFTAEEWQSAEKALDDAKIGRMGFWRALESIENTRKESCNAFAEEFALAQRALARSAAQAKSGRGKGASAAGIDPAMAKAIAFTEEASRIIAAQLGHDERRRQRYSNPFSLAQLYIHAKGDVAGFSRSCEAVARENQWRSMTLPLEDGELSARCSRMTSDSTRPFDGALARMLERQARRIADLKLAQIGDSVPAAIDIPLFIEENAFTFTEGLVKVKTGKNAQGRLKKRIERLEKRQQGWADKDERIRTASRSVCPYCGGPLGEGGEIDHIIPRSLTKKINGTVFNHEANLIYCHGNCNASKGNKVFGIENLARGYLVALFGTDDCAAVRDTIRTTVTRLAERRDLVFQSLPEEEQRDIRHALFLHSSDRETFNKALDIVKTQIKTRVNGTQAYLAKKTCEFLSKEIHRRRPDAIVNFRTMKVPAEAVSDLRRHLADLAPDIWRKAQPQPVASHVRDAYLALVCGEECDAPESVSFFGGSGDASASAYADCLENGFPKTIAVMQQVRKDDCDLRRVSGRAIFKDTLYQEHFVPVWSGGGSLRIGFDRSGLVNVKPRLAQKFFDAVRPFLAPDKEGRPPADTLAAFVASPAACWPIDKTKAIAWLFDYELEGGPSDSERYGFLECLRYTTVKKDVVATLFGKNNVACFGNIDKIVEKAIAKMQPLADAPIPLPIKDAWERIRQAFVKAGIADGDKDDTRAIAAAKRFFATAPDVGRKHRRVRKVFSLPVVDAPSGGIRIKRKDWRGNVIFQLAVGGIQAVGLAVSQEGSVDFGTEIRHPDLAKGKGISFVGGLSTSEQGRCEKINAWRKIGDLSLGEDDNEGAEPLQMELDFGGARETPSARDGAGVSQIELSPNSLDRMRVRCRVAWGVLREAYAKCGIEQPASPFGIQAELPSELAEACGLWKARSNLFVEEIGQDSVTVSYIVNSTSAEMKRLYNASSPN